MSKFVGAQLYSLRQELEQDFVATIEELAAIGYRSVEGWANMPLAHHTIAQLLKDYGLTMPSCHLPLPSGEKQREVMDAVEQYALQYCVVPWLDPKNFATVENVQRVCEQLNQANQQFQSSKVRFGYHNHDFEFQDLDGRTAYEIMIAELDPSIILEIDTYWVQLAGHDPGELVSRLGKRAPLLHIKDGEANSDIRDLPMVPLGEGNVDIDGIIAAGGQHTEGLIIELDSCATDMMAALQSSYQFMKNRGLAQ